MNIKRAIKTLAIMSIVSIGIVACSPAQTLERSQDFKEIGEKSAETAQKIYDALAKYNAGLIEEGVFVDMVSAWLPDDKRAVFESWIELGSDIRIAAEDIADSMMSTADSAIRESEVLKAKAESQQNKLDGFWSIVKSGISVATDPEGVIIGGLSALVLLINKRKNSETARANEGEDLARKASGAMVEMRNVAEDIVFATEAFKSTEQGREAWESVGRAVVSGAQKPKTIRFVQDVKTAKANGNGSVAKTRTLPIPIDGRFDATGPAPSPGGTPNAPGPENYDDSGNVKA